MNIDYDKIRCLRQQIAGIRLKMANEKEDSEKRKLGIQIKICELKIMVLTIK